MFTVVICDDNTTFLDLEKRLVDEFLSEKQEEHEVLCFQSGVDLLESGAVDRADLILLDYEMDGLSGLETARVIRKDNSKVSIAFVTVFYDFSREGYKVDAIRYLVKQESNFEAEFKDCINKALEIKKSRLSTQQKFDFLENSMLLELDDIVYIQTDKHYLSFCLNVNNTTLYRKMRAKMSDAAKVLRGNSHFFLIRTGVLINFKYVRTFDKNGAIFLKVKDEEDKMFMLSDSQKSNFLSAYARYYGGF